jgi:hypothetical protein
MLCQRFNGRELVLQEGAAGEVTEKDIARHAAGPIRG